MPIITINAQRLWENPYIIDPTIIGGSITGAVISGSSVIPSVVYNNSDTTINLTIADLNKIHVIENAAAVAVNLPDISASEIGYWLRLRKKGAGNLTINRGGADTIVGLTAIANTVAAQTYAWLQLIVEVANNWGMDGSLGSWTTS